MSQNNVKKPMVIGIAGGSGSGKTSVCRTIINKSPHNKLLLVEQDSYYKDQRHLSFSERLATNYDHPAAFDNALLYQQLGALIDGHSVEVPVYDYQQYTRSAEVHYAEPQPVILLEGILVLADPQLRSLLDIKVYVETADDIRIIRRIKRDTEERGRTLDSVIEQYLQVVRPMHHQFIEPTKQFADIIIPEGGQNQVAIDLLVTKITSQLQG